MAEGPPEKEFIPEVAKRFPAKTVASGALIQDERERILFVIPTYRPDLGIPGGIVDANETPLAACQREINEELGLDIFLRKLLVIDWAPQNGVWRDSLQFVFDGGVLTADQIARIVVPPTELSGFTFESFSTVAEKLKPSLYRRLERALEAKVSCTTLYTEFGR